MNVGNIWPLLARVEGRRWPSRFARRRPMMAATVLSGPPARVDEGPAGSSLPPETSTNQPRVHGSHPNLNPFHFHDPGPPPDPRGRKGKIKRRSGVRQNSREMAQTYRPPESRETTAPRPRSPFLPPAPHGPQLSALPPRRCSRRAGGGADSSRLLSLIAMAVDRQLAGAPVYVIAGPHLPSRWVGLVARDLRHEGREGGAGTRRARAVGHGPAWCSARPAPCSPRFAPCRAADLLVAVTCSTQVPGRRDPRPPRQNALPAAVRELDRSPDHPPRQPVTGLPAARLLLLVPRWPTGFDVDAVTAPRRSVLVDDKRGQRGA